ncbi:MAG: hypothetical protein OEV37_02440 [Candidatus Berkelbacteria bacterium]|nr:hypothetical protein [Candidatus Berkelbacteria bacterium]
MGRKRPLDTGGLKHLLHLDPAALAGRFRNNPDQLCEALVLCDRVKGRGSGGAADKLARAINCLDQTAMRRFLAELVRNTSHLAEMGVTGLALVGVVLGGVEDDELAQQIAKLAISSGSSSLTRLVDMGQRSSGRHRTDILAAVTGYVLPCLRQGLMPLAVSDEGGRGRLKVSRIDDPKGVIELRGLDWKLPGATANDVKWLCAVVDAALSASKMPEEGLGIVRAVSVQADEVVAGIRLLWQEISEAVGSGRGRSLKRWVPPDGLMEVRFELAGCTCYQLGYHLARLYPRAEQFPLIDLAFEFLHFGLKRKVTASLGENGLLDLLEGFGLGSNQWALLALLNQALVQELHRLAFSRGYCDNGRKAKGSEANGDGVAVLPHLVDLRRCGRMPSIAALERARQCGFAPPPGYTFAMSPALKCHSTHPNVRPRVVELTLGV